MKSCLSRLRVCWTKHALYVAHAAALWTAGLAAWLPLVHQDARALLQEVELSELAEAVLARRVSSRCLRDSC